MRGKTENLLIATIRIASVPLIVLNLFGGVTGAIWLAILGQWSIIGIGIIFMILMPLGYTIVCWPGIGLTFLGIKALEKHVNWVAYPLAYMGALYSNLLIGYWLILTMQLSLARSGADSAIPYVLWAYSVAVAPLAYMASKEDDDNIATTIGMYFAQLSAIGLGLSVIVTGSLLGGIAIIVFMSVSVPIINLILVANTRSDTMHLQGKNEFALTDFSTEPNDQITSTEADLWQEFRGRGNSNEILAEKAELLSTLILDCSLRDANQMKENCRSMCEVELTEHQAFEALLEFNFFYLHYADRIAFATLEDHSREYFIDALVERNKKVLLGLYDDSVDRVQLEASYVTTYNHRQSTYGECEYVYPEKDEGFRGTLYWEFSKLVSEKVGLKNDAGIIMATMRQIMLARLILEIEGALQCR